MTARVQPQATILFLAYNQQDFVAEAAHACLAQQGEPLEIIFSDDCSTDNTFAILQEVVRSYSGPHQVTVRQNAHNLGIADHYNTLVKLAQGELLITAAGDDISYPQRAQALVEAWRFSGYKLDLIASYAQSMTYEGQVTEQQIKVDQLANWNSAADWCRKRPYVIGATHAFTKRIWTKFGDIAPDIAYEDQVIALRALCMGGATTIAQPLLSYRAGGVSSKSAHQNINQKLATIERRYTRQRAVFAQVRQDLEHAGQARLWSGRVKKYWTRANAALQLLQWRRKPQTMYVLELWWMVKQCGVLWTIRQIVYTWK